jgi:serine protease AprX
LLKNSAQSVTAANKAAYKVLDINRAYRAYTQNPAAYTVGTTAQNFTQSMGTGTLEASRGTVHVSDGAVPLAGENDIFGAFSTATWANSSRGAANWSAGTWMGHDWTSTGYTTASGMSSWTGRAWSGRAWSGRAWSGQTWSGTAWSGNAWS